MVIFNSLTKGIMPDIKLDSMAPEPVLEVNGHKEGEGQEAEDTKREDRAEESDGEIDVDEDSRDVDEEDTQSEKKSHRTVIKVAHETNFYFTCVCIR